MNAVHVYQRARDRAGALVRDLAVLADCLRPGYAPDEPYTCARGHVTAWVHPSQYPAIRARRNPACRARRRLGRCGLELIRWPIRRELREALDAAGQPSQVGLTRLRALIAQKANGAPVQGGAAYDEHDLGSRTS